MRVRIDNEKCQGHGRCYELATALFSEDDEGYGTVIGDGTVSEDQVANARLAEVNCPENAVVIEADG